MATKQESEEWLNDFIREHVKCWNWARHKEDGDELITCNSIEDLIVFVEDFLKNGNQIAGWCFDNDEVSQDDFFLHYENYTGKKIEISKRTDYEGGSFIKCCC